MSSTTMHHSCYAGASRAVAWLQRAIRVGVVCALLVLPALPACGAGAGAGEAPSPHDDSRRPHHPWLEHQSPAATGHGAMRTPPPVDTCPWPAVEAALLASNGLLSVRLFNQTLHGTAGTAGIGDAAPAIRWAINATHLCGGIVFFPQGKYVVSGTIDVPTDTALLGGAGKHADQFQTGANGAVIETTAKDGPIFRVTNAMKIRFENLVVVGATNAIAIYGGALIRIINCGIHAQVVAGSGPDAVNTSSTGCRSCNIVYHSNNTALLVENTHVIPYRPFVLQRGVRRRCVHVPVRRY